MKKIIAFGSVFMPFIVSAQTSFGQAPGSNLDSFILWIKAAMNMATTLILGAAIVYLIWNVFGFVMAAGDEETRAEKRSGVIYGVIGVAIMVSIWGLVNFVTTSVGTVNTQQSAPVPIVI